MRESFSSDFKIGDLMPCPLPQKSTLVVARRDGGETIPVISDFPGCPLFTPSMGYAGDPHVIHGPV